jgi:P-type E1-E2 ATPase
VKQDEIAVTLTATSATDSEVLVARGGKFLGTLRVADMLRPEARKAIQSLRSMGLRTVLLTGDAKTVADEFGKQLGVEEISSELLPEEKLQFVNRLTGTQHKPMVGDGINDAPALMKATVGVAMGSGTDVAHESANVVLIGSDLSKLVETFSIARLAASSLVIGCSN